MRQVSGSVPVRSKADPNKEAMQKLTYRIVTQNEKSGSSKFRRYVWSLPSQPKAVLIQYIGDETVAGEVIHGNAKKNKTPRVPLLPSTAQAVRDSPNKPARCYEDMKMAAGATSVDQRLYSPASKAQVKNLKRNAKLQKGETDTMNILLELSQEFPDLQLLMINPRVLVVQTSP